jgi:hypothetical protein
MYPLALGIDKTETDFSISYGMPDLSKITGQEKPEEGEDTSLLEISGRDFAEIQAAYEKTQEKYLDLGHLEIVILGRALLENGGWQDALTYLKEEQNTGEDIYVFYAEDPESVLTWQGVTQTSAGEYLTELVRRAEASGRPCGVTLRDVYYSWYENGTLPELPEAVLQGETMEMIPVSS